MGIHRAGGWDPKRSKFCLIKIKWSLLEIESTQKNVAMSIQTVFFACLLKIHEEYLSEIPSIKYIHFKEIEV